MRENIGEATIQRLDFALGAGGAHCLCLRVSIFAFRFSNLPLSPLAALQLVIPGRSRFCDRVRDLLSAFVATCTDDFSWVLMLLVALLSPCGSATTSQGEAAR